ncbi:unnamed protein product, partial [Amoebophrya sp. A25]
SKAKEAASKGKETAATSGDTSAIPPPPIDASLLEQVLGLLGGREKTSFGVDQKTTTTGFVDTLMSFW